MLSFFAEIDTTSAVLGGIPGTLFALAALWKGQQEVKSKTRRDALSEWQEITDRQQKEIDSNSQELAALRLEVSRAQMAEAKCQGRVAQLESDMRVMSNDLRRIQERSHDLPPGVTRPVVIIANITGVIVSVSSEIGSMFNWLPNELVGKTLDVLMPRELRPVHKRSMEKIASENRNPDPDKPVITYGLTKTGVKFPILINLSGWSAPDGTKYINAEIRRRGDSDSWSNIPSTAQNTLPKSDTSKDSVV